MIVVISDLHLQHTGQDVVRRRERGQVLETRITRNVSAGALSLLFSEIVENAARIIEHADPKAPPPREIHLVFAGDIFELHRTPLWFLGGETLRPTLHPGAGSEPLERKVLSILSAIERDNREFFGVLREFVRDGTLVHRGKAQALEGFTVTPRYLPGNHDRLVRLWPSTRRRVRELLCIAPDGGPTDALFPSELEWDRKAKYGVRVRHGHEYDAPNFSESFDPAKPSPALAYERPTLGDFVTVDVATRIAVAFRAHYARQLRAPGAEGDPYRRVYAALTEFDDVRPQSMLVQYLKEAVGAGERETFSMLRPILLDAFETAMADSFFVTEAQRLDFSQYFKGGLASLIDVALKNLSGDAVVELLAVVDKFRHQSHVGGPARLAARERGLDTGDVSVIVAGHTHEPDHVALPGVKTPGGEAYFLDSGTWRTRIDAGEQGAFGRLRGYTMVFCYHDDELRVGEGRRFETWTGHLHGADYGPTLSAVVDATPRAPQTVRFLECRVQRIDEGETHNGAELVLYFGVDGAGKMLSFARVHDGDLLRFPEDTTLPVDPALDGEVWCYGMEKDLGDSLLDRDDPMPWSVRFLPRADEHPGAPFLPGRLEARAADNRGNAFTLVFELRE